MYRCRFAFLALVVPFIVSSLGLTMAPAPAHALVANAVHLHGRLLTTAGTPVPDGDYAVGARFYETKFGGSALHTYTNAKVSVKGGVFSLAIGAQTIYFLNGMAAWIGVAIGKDPELPRVALHKVPYAIRADSAAALACTGCVTSAHLAAGVLAGYAKTASLAPVATSGSYSGLKDKPTLVAPGQACPKDQAVHGFGSDGTVVCQPDKDTVFAGTGFALSDTNCGPGLVMIGVAADGKPKCAAALLVGADKTVDAKSSRIRNVLAPVAATDAATKAYVDAGNTGFLSTIGSTRFVLLYTHATINSTVSNAAETHPRLNITATRANHIGSASFELVGAGHCSFCYSGGAKAVIYATGNVPFKFHTLGSAVYLEMDAANFVAIRSSAAIKPVKVAALPAGAKLVGKLN